MKESQTASRDARQAIMAAKQAFIGEAELCDQLHDQHAEERRETFGRPASQPRLYQPHELLIIVPSKCLDEAKQQATVWGITAMFHTEQLADETGLRSTQ